VDGLDWADWAPDSNRIVFLTRKAYGYGVINVVDVSTTKVTTLDVPVSAHMVTWRPPDGAEILFRGEGPSPGIYAVRPDGTGFHAVSKRSPLDQHDYSSIALAPDGASVVFIRWVEQLDSDQLVVLDVATGAERILPTPAGTHLGGPVFSPDGKSIASWRWEPADQTLQVIVTPVDGSTQGRPIGPRTSIAGQPDSAVAIGFAPDQSALIARFGTDDKGTDWWLPLDGSPGSIIGTGSMLFVDVQRLPPPP
jgi:hypothetical protein